MFIVFLALLSLILAEQRTRFNHPPDNLVFGWFQKLIYNSQLPRSCTTRFLSAGVEFKTNANVVFHDQLDSQLT